MSFLRYKPSIEEGDTVIVYRGRERCLQVVVRSGGVIQTRGGAIRHDTLIGKEFGSKVRTSNQKGWVVVLHPTPELWTLSLPHRTQILYTTDISLISLHLGLRPGCVVVECGTGSGSLSHAIARTIAPDGHLFTFEFHEQRAEIARSEFAAHGLSSAVTISCCDVCRDGFGLEGVADAVFLDLPKPWEVILSAKKALKPTGGRICSFSPCIEQVQRTCEQLRNHLYTDIEVVECLQRPYDVRQYTLNMANMGGIPTPHTVTPHTPTPCTVSSHTVTSHTPAPHTPSPHTPSQVTLHTAQPTKTVPGHTGFMTFATLTPHSGVGIAGHPPANRTPSS